jgi:copper chaperone CopZ
MTHTYKVSGMTCGSCQASVQKLLTTVPGVNKVDIDLKTGITRIGMSKHIYTSSLQEALKPHPRYQLAEVDTHMEEINDDSLEKSWLATYKPIFLIFFYITAATLAIEAVNGGFDWMRGMMNFMAGFFLTFSFFKLLDLKGFADSFATYDIVAKRWHGWGYVYAFIELGLGFAYLTGTAVITTTILTLVVMTVSIAGVLQSVLNKRKIRCACLGAVFNLPMSTVTIIEDALMIVMSGIMLITLLS